MTWAVPEECRDEQARLWREAAARAFFKALIAAWKAQTTVLGHPPPVHAGWKLLPA